MKIVYSPQAIDDLRAYVEFVITRNPAAAAQFIYHQSRASILK